MVAINHFITDTDAEIAAVMDYVEGAGLGSVPVQALGAGLARHRGAGTPRRRDSPTAAPRSSRRSIPTRCRLFEKIKTIAKKIYRAGSVVADKSVRDQLKTWEDMGYGNLPVCMAKTQYSFSTDPNLRGAPTGHVVPIREVRLSAGAGFVVAICGEIMTMPGLPKAPSAEIIRFNDAGQIEGLF